MRGLPVRRHDLVSIEHHLRILPLHTKREEKMPRNKSDAERAPALANEYRAIGPAAIVAALLALKKRKPVTPLKPVAKAA